jgi:hypothetical protein
MVSYLSLILSQPLSVCMCLYEMQARLLLVILQRLMLPNATHAVKLRTELVRCVMGSLIANCWDLLFKAPLGLSHTRYKKISVRGIPVMIVPPTATLSTKQLQGNRPKLFMLYAHGGGYLFGEPLMWIASYERWVAMASSRGFDLVVVAVNYRTWHAIVPIARFDLCGFSVRLISCCRSIVPGQVSCLPRRLSFSL